MQSWNAVFYVVQNAKLDRLYLRVRLIMLLSIRKIWIKQKQTDVLSRNSEIRTICPYGVSIPRKIHE